MTSSRLLSYLLLLSTTACVDTYLPKTVESGTDLLVVDGFINSGTGSSTIRLTHALELKDAGKARVETGAVITLEGPNNSRFVLTEREKGVYTHDQINVNSSSSYQLKIKTTDHQEYVSDLLSVRKTPRIDNIPWRATLDGLQVAVNTHDSKNNTHYYQWEFEETWHYQSEFCTNLQYKNGEITYMSPYVNTHDCWRSNKPAGQLLVGTSVRLSQDVISEYPITYIPAPSGKINLEYSILVKQHALSKDAFDYYEKLKKSTEQLGSIFDAQPASLTGNIHGVTDGAKTVLGFVDIYDIEEKRIFITRDEVPGTFRVPAQEYCYTFTIDSTANYVRDLTQYYEGGLILPINPPDSTPLKITILNIPYAPRGCVDCRGAGTNVKPVFWPDGVTRLGCE